LNHIFPFYGIINWGDFMAYEVCRVCSKMFEKDGNVYCPDCIKKTGEEHDLIIEYIKKFPNATILDIISNTGVSIKSVQCLVDDGYVAYKDNNLEKIDKDPKEINKNGKFHIRRSL